MTTELTQCPNCNTKIKSSLLTTIYFLSENKTETINEYQEKKHPAYCNKCGNDLYSSARQHVISERTELTEQMQEVIDSLPIVSTHLPLNWEYDIIGMVTGQSTTGAGAVTEFAMDFTNFWGGQSSRYNQKIKDGTNLCFALLRKETLDLGGNAVIAADVDYSEVGGEKGMLMICATGTAVRLKNISVLGKDRQENIARLTEINDRLEELSSYNTEEQ